MVARFGFVKCLQFENWALEGVVERSPPLPCPFPRGGGEGTINPTGKSIYRIHGELRQEQPISHALTALPPRLELQSVS